MKAEILRGMELLDRQRPGWENKIELDRLNQGNDTWLEDATGRECGCVLVQVFGDYFDGIEQLEISGTDSEALGFNLGFNHSFKTLTAWWKRLFRIRYGGF